MQHRLPLSLQPDGALSYRGLYDIKGAAFGRASARLRGLAALAASPALSTTVPAMTSELSPAAGISRGNG